MASRGFRGRDADGDREIVTGTARAASWSRAAAIAIVAMAAGAVALLHLPALPGAFLSDDYGLLDLLLRNDRGGTLGSFLLDRFAGSLQGAGNFAYRPIGFLSFALDWRLFGASPAGWHATSLVLHLANAALVYALASRWVDRGRVRLAAPLAAAAFAAYPFVAELTLWVAARFDLIAALFGLLFLATLDGLALPSSGRQALRVVLLLAALMSKESAMPLPVIAFAIDVALAIERGRSPRDAVIFAIRDLAPVLLAFAVYLAWRYALFGTALKVYPASRLPESSVEYLERLATLGAILRRQPDSDGTWTFAVVIATLLVAIIAAAASGRRSAADRTFPIVAACIGGAALYALAPALSFPSATDGGEGARNYYIGWVFGAIAIGGIASRGRVATAFGLAFVAVLLAGQAGAVKQWSEAGREMNRIVTAAPNLAATIPDDGYALLLLPDRIGPVVFARNGQGGIVSRPVQKDDLLDRVAGMTENDFASWRAHFSDGTLPRLKSGRPFDPAHFAGAFCWSSDQAAFVRVGPPGPIASFDAWEVAVRAAVARTSCLRGTAGPS